MEQFSNGDIFVGEVIGTAILILFGAGVCAAVNLCTLQGEGCGLDRHRLRLGLRRARRCLHRRTAVRGAHQPGRDHRASATDTGTEWSKVPLYIVWRRWSARSIGAVLAWLLYYAQFAANADQDHAEPTLGNFSTAPEIRNPAANLITEIIATAVLVPPLFSP